MFFLISYGLLNYATYFEAKTESPSFRPRFKWFSPRLSLLGFFICLGAMLAIDLKSGAAAIALLFAIYQYLKRTAGPVRWADSTRSHHLKQVRQHLLAAVEEPEHARDWRPHLLVFTQDANHRAPLLAFASWIEGGSGFTEAVQIIEGEGRTAWEKRKLAHQELIQAIASSHYDMFPLTVSAPDFIHAVEILLQSSGIGPLRPNTVIFNWRTESEKSLSGMGIYQYTKNLNLIFRQGKNLLILRMDLTSLKKLAPESLENRRIDIWWQGNASSRLMLLFAHLMTRHKPWKRASLRVLTKSDQSGVEAEKKKITKTMEDIRIDASAEIVEDFDADTIVKQSADASFVFLPLTIKENQIVDPRGKSFNRSLPRLPGTALVMAAEDIDLDATPEEGLPALISQARDALEAAQKRATAAEHLAMKRKKALETLSSRLNELEDDTNSEQPSEEEDEELKNEIENAEFDAEKAYRLAVRAKTKVDDVTKTIDMLSPGSQSKTEPSE